jgi:hypothetical protein
MVYRQRRATETRRDTTWTTPSFAHGSRDHSLQIIRSSRSLNTSHLVIGRLGAEPDLVLTRPAILINLRPRIDVSIQPSDEEFSFCYIQHIAVISKPQGRRQQKPSA